MTLSSYLINKSIGVVSVWINATLVSPNTEVWIFLIISWLIAAINFCLVFFVVIIIIFFRYTIFFQRKKSNSTWYLVNELTIILAHHILSIWQDAIESCLSYVYNIVSNHRVDIILSVEYSILHSVQ